MFIKWCDTPCPSLNFCECPNGGHFPCLSLEMFNVTFAVFLKVLVNLGLVAKRRVLEVRQERESVPTCLSLPANNIYVSVKRSLACPTGAGYRFAVTYVPELYLLAQRGEAIECAFAAAALALHGLNVDRAFWSSGWTRPHVASDRRHVWRHAPVGGHVRVLLATMKRCVNRPISLSEPSF